MPNTPLVLLPGDGDVKFRYGDKGNAFSVPENNVSLRNALRSISAGRDARPSASTPSIYRRPIDFFNILNADDGLAAGERRSELCKIFTRQWRDIITLLALNAKRTDLNIRFKEIFTGQALAKSSFLRICDSDNVQAHLPTDGLFNGMTWRGMCAVILKYNKAAQTGDRYTPQTVIAGTSPVTLFFPVEDFDAILAWNSLSTEGKSLGESLSLDEKKYVFDWIQQLVYQVEDFEVKANAVLKRLVKEYADELAGALGNAGAGQGWNAAQKRHMNPARFEYNQTFIGTDSFNAHENDFLRFTVRDITNVDPLNVPDPNENRQSLDGRRNVNLESEQEALQRAESDYKEMFTALALNSLRNLGIKSNGYGFYYSDTGKYLAVNSNGEIRPSTEQASDVLRKSAAASAVAPFEWRCVIQYLDRLLTRLNGVGEIGEETRRSITEIRKEIIEANAREADVVPWPENRFTGNPGACNPQLEPYNFTVNRYTAPFFEDTMGYMDGDSESRGFGVINDWFNMLQLIALKDIRSGINITHETMTDPAGQWVSGRTLSPFCEFVNRDMLNRAIKLNGWQAAATCADTVFCVTDNGPVQAAIEGFWTDRETEHNCPALKTVAVGPWRLFEFEILLLIKYYGAFAEHLKAKLDRYKKEEIAADVTDGQAIINLVTHRRERLEESVGNADMSWLDECYPFDSSEFIRQQNEYTRGTPLELFFASVEDGLYEDTLVPYIYDTEVRRLVRGIKNFGGKKGDLGDVVGGRVGEYKVATLLPFKESAYERMYRYHESHTNQRKDTSTTAYYGLDYVEAYYWKHGDTGVYDVICKPLDEDCPMIKRYFSKDEGSTVYLSRDKKEPFSASSSLVPSVSVWPDVEIEGWNEYNASVFQFGNLGEAARFKEFDQSESILGHIVFPEFIKGDRYRQRDNYVKARYNRFEKDYYVDVAFTSHKLAKYPRVLGYNIDGVKGCIFARPFSVKNQDISHYISRDDLINSAVIGLDFGTTNSTAFFVRGIETGEERVFHDPEATPEPFDMLYAESNYLTNSRKDERYGEDIAEVIASQRRWYYDPIRPGYFTYRPTLLAAYQTRPQLALGDGPFMHSNIYPLSGYEISKFESSVFNKDD
ncbi:MAG: hypothetical protein LBS19_14465, partial [Clostridiales bacterium]|nr:hypothetical protein [Clostridiales bacterium]